MSKYSTDFNFFDEKVLNYPHEFYKISQDQAPVYDIADQLGVTLKHLREFKE
ncbi:MAG: hypothetical protein ACJAYG_002694 [Oceanicoccus sp.]|jgi:hypothetical protein